MNTNLLRGFGIGDYEIEPLIGQITGPGGVRRVQPKVMQVLLCLAEHAGEVIERDAIIDRVWKGRAVSDESLTRCISELRLALSDQRDVPAYIQTIPTRGYRLIAHVRPIRDRESIAPTPSRIAERGSTLTAKLGDTGFKATLAAYWFELVRRRVVQTAAGYLIGAWMVVEATALLVDELNGPEWPTRLSILLAIIGLPIVLVLAWIFDIERTDARQEEASIPPRNEHLSKVGAKAKLGAPPSPDSAVASVAVLPFDNLTKNSEHAYLADGIASELHSTLSRVDRLRIVSRQSSFAFRGSDEDVKEIGHRLQVHYIILGSVLYNNGHIRVIAEFDNADDGIQIWSQTYDREIDDIFKVEQDIAQAIVSTFGGERLRAEILEAQQQPTKNLDAWGLVQKARAYLLDYRIAALTEAVELLSRAVNLDPDYAAAHAAFGAVLAERMLNGLSSNPEKDKALALSAAAQAQALSPNDPFVVKLSGVVWAYCGDYRQSITALRRAVHLAPFDFGAWGYLGWPLVLTGEQQDLQELHHILDRLLEMAPHHPGVSYWLYHKSVAYTCAGDDRAGADFAEKSVHHQPNFSLAWMQYANALGGMDKRDSAAQALARSASINPAMTPRHYVSVVRTMCDSRAVAERRIGGLRKARLLRA